MKCKNYEDFCVLFNRVSDMIARLDYGGSMIDLSPLREHLDSIDQANPIYMKYYMGIAFEIPHQPFSWEKADEALKDTGFRTTNDCPDYLRS